MSILKKHFLQKKGHFTVKAVFKTLSLLPKSLSSKSENTETWLTNQLPQICFLSSQGNQQLMTNLAPINTKKHQSRVKEKVVKKAKSYRTWLRTSLLHKSSKWTKFRKSLKMSKLRKNTPSMSIKIMTTKMIKNNLVKTSKISEEDFTMQLT